MKCYSVKHLWDHIGVGKITNKIVIEVIEKSVVNNKSEKLYKILMTNKHT